MPRPQFTLRELLVLMLGFACAAAAFIAGSPLWWLIWLVVLGLITGVSAYRASRSRSGARTVYLTIAAIAGVGIVHGAVARHPWTGSWLLGLALNEAMTGNGWFTWYGASAIGIMYALFWSTTSLLGGALAWLVFGTRGAEV